MIGSIGNTENTSNGFSNAAVGSAQDQKDQFLKLLTYQLKSQNPLKPYDNQEFASQLAQFSQLEQLSDIRTLMEDQSKYFSMMSTTMSNAALPGLLGKGARALTSHINLEQGTASSLGYTLDSEFASGEIEIRNEFGSIVRTIDLGPFDLGNGDHTIAWDGTDNEGNQLSDGNYTFFADFESTNGEVYSAPTFTTGKIEAVRFKNDGTVLIINGQEVSLADVLDLNS